jgi:transcriptional regulator with XRE-family HTH domain
MTKRVARGVVLTCDECGYQTRPTTEGQAERSLRLHSCDLTRARAARAERVAARKAASGPVRDCQHTHVHHEHGHRLAYIRDRCRCRPCRDANAAYQASIDRAKAYGTWNPYTDAEPVREHVRWLMSQGMGWQRVGRIAGISSGAMTKLLYGGRIQADGTRRAPSKRMRHDAAARLLAVRPDLELLGAKALVDGTGTRRRLQALVAAGWSQAKVAERLGMTGTNLGRVINHSDLVQASTARAVRDLYDQMWDAAPPEEEWRDRIAASRARSHARRNGWMPPLAWDDESIDDPAAWANVNTEPGEGPDLDEIAVERLIAGDDWRAIGATRAERITAAERLWWHWRPIRERQHADGTAPHWLDGPSLTDIERRFSLRAGRDFRRTPDEQPTRGAA